MGSNFLVTKHLTLRNPGNIVMEGVPPGLVVGKLIFKLDDRTAGRSAKEVVNCWK